MSAVQHNLIDSFKEQGWDFLIPSDLRKTSTGEYVSPETEIDIEEEEIPLYDIMSKPHRLDDYEPEVWDDIDGYYNNMLDYEEEDEDEEDDNGGDEENANNTRDYSQPNTLYDLKYDTDNDALTDEEFLSLTAGELLGITNSQLKFVSKDAILSVGLGRYKDFLQHKTDKLPSIEQKIKYSNVMTQVGFTFIALSGNYNTEENRKKIDEYITKIAVNKPEAEAVSLLNDYRDYINMYPVAYVINEEHKENGELFFNYVLFPKPSHIKDLHDKATRDFNTYMSRIAAKERETTNELIKMFVEGDKYQKYLYKGKNFSVIAVKSAEDILYEAEKLKHCVASYIDSFSQGKTYLYFIRDNKKLDVPLYTVELLPCRKNRYGHEMYLNQCYGYRDTIKKSWELESFITEWCVKKNIDIRCVV